MREEGLNVDGVAISSLDDKVNNERLVGTVEVSQLLVGGVNDSTVAILGLKLNVLRAGDGTLGGERKWLEGVELDIADVGARARDGEALESSEGEVAGGASEERLGRGTLGLDSAVVAVLLGFLADD